MSAPLLAVEELVATFPLGRGRGHLRAVDGVSLSVAPGEALGLVGESGSGKTTLARVLVRLLPAAAGRVTIDGIDVRRAAGAELARLRRSVQMVFQDPSQSLDPRMAVGDAVAEPLAVHRLPPGPRRARRTARRARVAELLEAVGLPAGAAARRPAELSGGERQRVAIARALALEPRLLILDEPVSSLDPTVGAQVMALLAELRASRGLSYLLIAHDLALVGSAADRVAVMYMGRIVESAPTARLYAGPRHPYTRALLEAVAGHDPRRERGRRPPAAGEPPDPAHPPPGCPFHPRCPRAEPLCVGLAPPLHRREDEVVACHFPG